MVTNNAILTTPHNYFTMTRFFKIIFRNYLNIFLNHIIPSYVIDFAQKLNCQQIFLVMLVKLPLHTGRDSPRKIR